MKKIVVGILAHVDAGKTTLSEGLLFTSGEIRKLGRVDSRDTFLDTDEVERARGITVFSKQATLTVNDTEITLLDTPGHTDFAAEAERTLSVLDYAILVISATDGVQSHTKTLWEMLSSHRIPTFIFLNKLDLQNADKNRVIQELKAELSDGIVDFCDYEQESLCENIAVCDEEIMHTYLESGEIDKMAVGETIRARKIYPCFSGSALKMEGVESFLKALDVLSVQKQPPSEFGAKVFKIATDERGQRLTFMKITGAGLKVKDLIDGEKVNEIRIYSGEKYKGADYVSAGTVCAVTGLSKTFAGQGIGIEENAAHLTAQPIFTYRVVLPQGVDAAVAVAKLRELEQEETQLNVTWNEQLAEIQIKLMGEIQLEVLKHRIKSRFEMDVEFCEGRIVYKETIKSNSYGVGHYEPLRHYAEVHLLLEPLPQGSGMHFTTDCSEDILDKNWQRMILTHLMEKNHAGVLTGSDITDIKITLKTGKAHNKHTEGGDFRQATYRAVRQALRKAESVLLEPYYEFSLEVPKENVGRAMTDLDQMGATISLPQTRGEFTKVTGTVSANAIRNYHREIISYTHGLGKLSVKFNGYGVCQNAQKVIEEIGYNADSDIENTADSVFCDHGAGFLVPWYEVDDYKHLDSAIKPKKQIQEVGVAKQLSVASTDAELLRIFEKTYGKVETKIPQKVMRKKEEIPERYRGKKSRAYDKEYLLIDGYNIIFAWDDLKALAGENLESARVALIERMKQYRAFCDVEVIIVFDAYKVKGNVGEIERVGNLSVVYTKEAQTADAYIEKTARELSKNYKVTVATSDSLEQLIVFGGGAYRMSARAFLQQVEATEERIRGIIFDYNIKDIDADFFKIIKEKLSDE
ncbi:MAG: TetM/TetW/TetO/TetS family tetracycline resistance ribosomal protection protein [Clostridia bacterium]|nr:TetM/TetW/TetO/TetS family tetracycline resistance ribosomal protection protein [Clostridia bacterium]